MQLRASVAKSLAWATWSLQRPARIRQGCARRAMATGKDTSAQSHYQSHSQASYESAYFYSPGAYMDFLQEKVLQTFQLSSQPSTHFQPKRRLLDIGGGTGNFTKRLLPYLSSAVIVDPFLSSDSDPDDARLVFVAKSAESFADKDGTAIPDWKTNYDFILLKEVVHHLENRLEIFRGFHRALNESGSSSDTTSSYPQLLIITRPHMDIDYPLWPAAEEVWASHQPSAKEIEQELYDAGFSHVHITIHSYPCEISLPNWQSMVRQRFWSTFSHFSDTELEAACADMPSTQASRLHDNGRVLRFDDRLVFISAKK